MFLEQVPEGAPDPVFGRLADFRADPRPHKMSLIIGIYQDRDLHHPILRAVQKGRERVQLAADYLPMDGIPEFSRLVGRLCFGEKLWGEHAERIYSAQSVGGTGALRVIAEFLKQQVGDRFAIPDPTWPTHRSLLERVGAKVEILPFYDHQLHDFDRNGYFKQIRNLPPKSILLLHAACHNPSGSDPSLDDWNAISDLCKEKNLFPFFDFAYQGFGDGVEQDAAAVRLFLEKGHEMAVAYSCSKNFGLYSERVGSAFLVASSQGAKERIGSQVRRVIRAMYSNPPAYGARIVATILKDPALVQIWQTELDEMRSRISEMRRELVVRLSQRSKKMDFRFILKHKGMFSYLDLTQKQVAQLIERYGIYSLDCGRVNIAGLNEKNVDYFVDSLIEVCQS